MTSTGDLRQKDLETPVGWLRISAAGGKITRVDWLDERHSCSKAEREPADSLLAGASQQMHAYFAGKLEAFDLPLAPAGSAFQRAVWLEMCRIPFGAVLTYGEMANRVGGIARAVGGACGANPIPIIIPCHRVVAGHGLGGYSGGGGLETKRRLLELEGVLPPELPLTANR